MPAPNRRAQKKAWFRVVRIASVTLSIGGKLKSLGQRFVGGRAAVGLMARMTAECGSIFRVLGRNGNKALQMNRRALQFRPYSMAR